MDKCSECEFSEVWPTGEGRCSLRDKGLYGNDEACAWFENQEVKD